MIGSAHHLKSVQRPAEQDLLRGMPPSHYTGELMLETQSEADLHQLLVPTPRDERPRVPPKNSPASLDRSSSDAESFFVPDSLSRTTSVFSFSRASFSSLLANLTSLSLPQAESLAASIAALPTASKAVKALNQAAEQIQQWTTKAQRVLHELEAEDDVEWAAAAGREGLQAVDQCVRNFEHLISVYVQAIEELQSRPDIADVHPDDLQAVVEQMEITLIGWDNVRQDMKAIHDQVELAMEWQELWVTVLGDVGAEMDSLSQLVFEMEEKRHSLPRLPAPNDAGPNVDLYELQSWVNEPASANDKTSHRFSLIPAFDASPLGSPIIENSQDDTNLLSLFARMQPLRASLDFLPMRLSMFQSRAEKIFPAACQELEDKRDRFEKNWSQLSKEAESLRRELSEDRWVVVFRNAGRQAQKMCESVARSVEKVQEAVEAGYQRSNPVAFTKRVDGFEAKKMHYGPAIDRVLAIIQKGLKDRLTVHGEIIRLHKDISERVRAMTEMVEDMEALLENLNANQNARLRESISSIVSADRSFSSTTHADTPLSSPASSVDLSAPKSDRPTPKYGLNGYSKPRAASSSRPPLSSANRRSSALPPVRRPITPSQSYSTNRLPRRMASPSPGPPSVYRQGAYVPPTTPLPRPAPNPLMNKPRWSAVTKTDDPAFSQKNRSPSASGSVSFHRVTPRSISRNSSMPHPSPLSRESSSSPSALPTPSTARRSSQQFRSFAERVASPQPARNRGILDPLPYHRGRNATAPVPGTIRSPSSLASHQHSSRPSLNSNASVDSAASTVAQPYPPRQSSIPLSGPAETSVPKASHRSEDSAIDLDADEFENDGLCDQTLQQTPEQSIHRPTTTPPRPTSRPPSALAMSSKGKRMSMLPIPTRGSSMIGGRQSSLGQRQV